MYSCLFQFFLNVFLFSTQNQVKQIIIGLFSHFQSNFSQFVVKFLLKVCHICLYYYVCQTCLKCSVRSDFFITPSRKNLTILNILYYLHRNRTSLFLCVLTAGKILMGVHFTVWSPKEHWTLRQGPLDYSTPSGPPSKSESIFSFV